MLRLESRICFVLVGLACRDKLRQARPGRCLLPLRSIVGMLRVWVLNRPQASSGVDRSIAVSRHKVHLAFLILLLDHYPYLTLSIGEDTVVLFLYSWLPGCLRRSSRPFTSIIS